METDLITFAENNYGHGLTCRRFLRVVWKEGNYILFKHDSHAEYINRFRGQDTCASYFVLLDVTKMSDNQYRILIGSPSHSGEIWRDYRRWSKSLKAEIENIVNTEVILCP